jgi:putative pyruvate formate lyase activating enzyme
MWWRLRPDALIVLREERVRLSLTRYFAAMQDQKPAKFLISKKVPAIFGKRDSAEALWHEHTRRMQEYSALEGRIDDGLEDLGEIALPEQSLLDLKIELANRILQCCSFCTRRCGVDRANGKLGYCRCGPEMMVSGIFEHLGEEPELVPSGTIFAMGCTMRCLHCQNYAISQWVEAGRSYTPERLAEEVEVLRSTGCRNANLVGGEPTPWLNQWLEAFKRVNTNIPIVWNSNSYYSPETAQILAGFADVYLLDFKYGPGECAARISDAKDYWTVCTRNHLDAKKNGEVIVRILVLPHHLECCTRPTVKWIAENLGVQTRVNLMFQYRPEWRAHEVAELQRGLSEDEMDEAVRLAQEAGLANFMT